MLSEKMLINPILKWVGGKRQLLPQIIPHICKKCTTYVEPFLGGGSVLFAYRPSNAIVNDLNSELINVYRVIRDNPEDLIKQLKEHKSRNSQEYYYEIRGLDRTSNFSSLSPVQRAARIIYLNKTCYNGLYRVNSSGQFNSPYGRYKNPNIVNEVGIRAVSRYFSSSEIKIKCGDYKEVLKNLEEGSFVYLDPPYMPLSSSSSFTGYTEGGFDYQKQIELKEECDKLREKGIAFLLSNSDCEQIRQIYQEYKIETVQAKRSINSVASKRGEINEVLIYYAK